MRVVLCNKYFFLNGGIEKYLKDLLGGFNTRGHLAVPFSVSYAGSWESAYAGFFMKAPASPGEIHYRSLSFNFKSWLRLADRSVYSFEARRRLSKLLRELGSVDIGLVLNTCNYMSPSVIHTFKKHGIPVVVHLGDYHLLCPNYLLLRDGRPCELCIRGDYLYGLRYRCVKDSLFASGVRALSMYVHELLSIYRLADAFVVPCDFMRTKMIEGGYPGEKIHLLRYPVADAKEQVIPPVQRGNYILYFGRLSREKGLDTLIRAYQAVSPPEDLVLIGRSYDGEDQRLKDLIRPELRQRIRLLGFMDGSQLAGWIARARLTVVPSRWYDNAPISIYESFSAGTPVLAARIGGIPEQVMDGVNGCLFTPDSQEDLARRLQWMLADKERLFRMGEAGKRYIVEHLALHDHIDALTSLFEGLISTRARAE